MKGKWIIWIVFLITVGVMVGWKLTKSRYERENKVIMAGSVAMETFALGIAELTEAVPEFIGSSAGIEALQRGKAEIAMVSRYLTREEKKAGIVENLVAYDGIVIAVHKENPIDNLSREQLIAVFTGKVTNWKQLGGNDEVIIPIGREQGSGTRDSFESLLEVKGKTRYANECDSIGVVKTKIELLEGAIGYISLESGEGVKILSVEQIYPDMQTIGTGKYTLVRPFILATKGKITEQEEKVQRIFHLLKSRQGEILFERAKISKATIQENE